MFVTPSSFLPVSLRRVGGVALACSALVLSACGGGDRAAEYQPASIVSFGDENSAFASYQGNLKSANLSTSATLLGLTYTVNRTETSPSLTCTNDGSAAFCASAESVPTFTATSTQYVIADTNYPNTVTRLEVGGAYKRTTATTYFCNVSTIWTQVVARAFGKGYEADCQLDRAGAVSHAVAGAKVAELSAQIAQAKSAGQLKSGALVTVWLGQNDLVEIFDSTASLADKEAAAKARAATLIDGVKQILATGAKVVLVNAPNLAYSPYALARNAVSCADVSSRPCNPEMDALVVAFNKQLISSLGTEYALNGRQLGYVDAAQLTNTYARSTSYENKRQCDAGKMVRPDGVLDSSSLAYCNVGTLENDGNVGNYLWADDVRVSWTLHSVIASTAVTRAAEQF